jgi:hypothetical protein
MSNSTKKFQISKFHNIAFIYIVKVSTIIASACTIQLAIVATIYIL